MSSPSIDFVAHPLYNDVPAFVTRQGRAYRHSLNPRSIMPAESSRFRVFLHKLLEMNEQSTNRVDDANLLQLMVTLYPNLELNLYGREKSPVPRWRSEYNRGRFGIPAIRSFRYNEHKQPIDSLSRVMSEEQIQQKQMEFKYASAESKTRRNNPDRRQH